MPHIHANPYVLRPKLFLHIIYMLKKGSKVSRTPKETGYAAYTYITVGIRNGFNNIIGFGPYDFINGSHCTVAGDHRFFRNLGGFQAGLPPGVGIVNDYPHLIHLLNYRPSEVT